MNKDILYSKAIVKFGAESQMRMCQEECAELTAAINQFSRGRLGWNKVAEELADVMIMCEQLSLMFDDELVSKFKKLKLKRLKELVKK